MQKIEFKSLHVQNAQWYIIIPKIKTFGSDVSGLTEFTSTTEMWFPFDSWISGIDAYWANGSLLAIYKHKRKTLQNPKDIIVHILLNLQNLIYHAEQ